MKEFQRICTLDKGMLVGAEATQWARDATNITEIKAMAKAATTLDIDVLTGDQEGIYGYVAATRNAPEKFSLDPGSNSFQLGWLPKGETQVKTVSVPFGYVRAADKYYKAETMNSYDAARAEHAADVKMQLEAALGKLTPPVTLAQLKASITAGNLEPEIFLPGQDGALHLSLKAQLRDMAGKWIDEQKAYDDRVAMEKPMVNATFGDVTTTLMPADADGLFHHGGQAGRLRRPEEREGPQDLRGEDPGQRRPARRPHPGARAHHRRPGPPGDAGRLHPGQPACQVTPPPQ